MSLIQRKTDWFSIIERKWEHTIQSSIFDWKWNLLKEKKDDLLYNINWINKNWKEIDPHKRLETIWKTAQKNIADLLIWTDFKKPSKELVRLTETSDLYDYLQKNNKFINLWYADNTIIFNTPKILKELWINSLSLWWAVADCGWICWNYNNWEIISISHAWWGWITNWVIEQLIYTYMAELWKKEFQKVQFDFSPMGWINYEWDKNSFDKNLLNHMKYLTKQEEKIVEEISKLIYDIVLENKKIIKNYNSKLNEFNILHKKIEKLTEIFNLNQKFSKIAEEYNIDYMKDKIVEKSSDPKKVIFFLDRLIKRIFLENWANIEQLNFHKEQTTDLNNTWPSYRIHTLREKWIIGPDMTLKWENWIIPDSRLWVFNTVYKK